MSLLQKGKFSRITTTSFTVSNGDIVSIGRQAGTVKYFTNTTLRATHTGGFVPTIALVVFFAINVENAVAASAEQNYIDWAAMRNWVDPEPAHGAWGNQETGYFRLAS